MTWRTCCDSREPGAHTSMCLANEQTRLLNEPCVRCGHVGELLIEQHDGMVCVNCITKDNGEDGEP